VLFALEHPVSLGVLLLSFVLGLTAHGWVQCLVADRIGDRRPRLEGRLKADPRHHLDPFGVVAGLLSGLGWCRPVEVPVVRRRGPLLAITLSGPAVNLVAGVAMVLAWRFAYGPGALDNGFAEDLQRGIDLDLSSPGALLLLAGASQLYLGLLSLVPLPPLDGGRLLFGLAPRTHGWLKAEHQLVERNIGTVVLLALLVIPLGDPVPVLPQVLDTLLEPVLRLLVGG
jgi:Zn-dependent protease